MRCVWVGSLLAAVVVAATCGGSQAADDLPSQIAQMFQLAGDHSRVRSKQCGERRSKALISRLSAALRFSAHAATSEERWKKSLPTRHVV